MGVGESFSVASPLERERWAKLICAELNRFTELRDALRTVTAHLRKVTGAEAVAMRLCDDGDYLYFVNNGFPDDFVRRESSLCARDRNGLRLPEPAGCGYLLECMCGNVIRGRTDPDRAFFTRGGSFWTNSTTDLLAATTDRDLGARTRNYCNIAGYESVALVPILAQEETLGLVQVNDHRRGIFEIELIEWLEMIGCHIGQAVRNSLAYQRVKEAAERLGQHAAALTRANEELRRFAHSVSHDLQEPLRAITGFTEMLRRSLEPGLTPDALKLLDTIENAGHDMSRLIGRLLEYSRAAGRPLSAENVDLGSAARDAVRDLDALRRDTGATIDIGPLPVIRADAMLMKLLFQNLIGNAMKFRRLGVIPEVTVSARRGPGSIIAVQVSDNGIGIEAGDAARIFEPFARLRPREESPGTGLGLAICRRIAERHSGTIEVRSEPGKGTTFVVTFPADAPSGPPVALGTPSLASLP